MSLRTMGFILQGRSIGNKISPRRTGLNKVALEKMLRKEGGGLGSSWGHLKTPRGSSPPIPSITGLSQPTVLEGPWAGTMLNLGPPFLNHSNVLSKVMDYHP